MSGILPSAIITIGILVFGIFFLIKKRIDNKKETGTYFSFSSKKNPFLYVGLPFLILTIILYLIAGEDTIYSTISLMITYSIFLIWLFIYLPIKFFTNIKDKKVKKTKNFGGALVWILILSFMGFFLYAMIKAGV